MLYLTDPTATTADSQRAVMPSMSHPFTTSPTGCTTQDYMNADSYDACPTHHVNDAKDYKTVME